MTKNKSLTKHAKGNIREIHALSLRYNGKKRDHSRKLLAMVKEHAKEISGLYRKKDPHFSTEVGDLLVLCHELLLEKGKDPDKILETCYKRFKDKLAWLLCEETTSS